MALSKFDNLSDREILVSVAVQIDQIVQRLDKVEEVASEVKDYPSFRQMITEKIEKYEKACLQVEGCPVRMEKIESSVSHLGERVENLERNDIRDDAQGDVLDKLWQIVNQPVGMGLIVAAAMIYLHITGGKV